MQKSTVYVSMNDTNNLDCSYAIIEKESKNAIIIFKGLECIILDYDLLINDNYNNHYLLLKHYENTTKAYKDFMKLIGKMCKKSVDSKYFKKPIDEDNWMVFENDTNEHMITIEEKANYLTRKNDLINFINDNKDKFIKE
ncbi:MAG: hypothetical protein J5892_01185 [Bacilli bacterium]|nr:hypothetical protein [Bacilli bacterium]